MAPVLAKEQQTTTTRMAPSTLTHASSSQAESVAEQVAGVTNNDDATVASTCTPPGSPPRGHSPVRQESALKRLTNRLRLHRRARRSLSAPPATRRRHDKLLEEHFVLEKAPNETLVVLPGVPKHEDNWARDLHDFFNLVVLVPVVALNMMNWNWDKLLNNWDQMNSLGDAWTDEWFYAFFYVTALYFLADLLWILVVPTCVRSPSVIIQHHVATLLYISVPFKVPIARWFMGACMSVEINTWLLIARRVFNKQGFPPWTIIDLSFFSIRVKLISIFFYITWIGIRCILYPCLMRPIFNAYLVHSEEQGTKVNLLLFCFPLHAVFCVLNLKWSYDLLMSKIRYWSRKGGTGENDATKDKGL